MAEKIGSNGGRKLVIVESPAKAKTIAAYLGKEYLVESSIGHIRDLPNRAAEIPASEKQKPWARLGVDVDHEFEPMYIVNADKKRVVTDLKAKLKGVDELLLATDEDREGEAIAWHLKEVLKPSVPVRRMVFHEITKEAIERALGETREIDERLVDAQETRRILDRLYGYEVSPVLWKKVMTGLSAGRVQSVATRLIVERERERIAFRAAEWWDIEATLDPGTFTARLASVDGRRIARGRDFADDGTQQDPDLLLVDEALARGLVERLSGRPFLVRSVEEKPYLRRPAAPFTTSTLQQEASRKLRFSAQTTMRVAQRLYERGYITYMRTDSTTLSSFAIDQARSQARELFGAETVPERPRTYDKKVKNAQEAHEAVRPAGDRFRRPADVVRELDKDEGALYELVWQRTIASQMEDAKGQTVSVRIAATSTQDEEAEFTTAGTVITFRGFLAAYEEGSDEDARAEREEEKRLPPLEEGQELAATALEPEGHTTTAPPRYTEASLVKALEERGIGRPSTYASIIGTIIDRGYVFKKGTALVPSWIAFAVIRLLEDHFGRLVDYDFTARMEDDLDRIALGDEERVSWLRGFYFGDGDGDAVAGSKGEGLKHLVTDLGEIDARAVNSIAIGDEIVLRIGRYGPYVERGGDRASVPEDLAPDELTVEVAEKLFAAGTDQRTLGEHPETGRPIVARSGRYGPYVTETLDEGDDSKPKSASLFSNMSIETLTLDDAVRLLSLPRAVGVDPADGEVIEALNGRYGPYIKKGTETRSLEGEESLFTVTLDEALALLAAPKPRRGQQKASSAPLKELGPDPTSEKPIVVKEGRFGPYVTDGETNASLRKQDSVEAVTLDRALELLAERRAKAPTKRKPAQRKASAKKPATKKSSGKRAS